MKKDLTMLVIMDGFGLSDNTNMNAVHEAGTPVISHLMNEYPWCKISASGRAVGLPDGQMGNSEVGHINMGAGRVVTRSL